MLKMEPASFNPDCRTFFISTNICYPRALAKGALTMLIKLITAR